MAAIVGEKDRQQRVADELEDLAKNSQARPLPRFGGHRTSRPDCTGRRKSVGGGWLTKLATRFAVARRHTGSMRVATGFLPPPSAKGGLQPKNRLWRRMFTRPTSRLFPPRNLVRGLLSARVESEASNVARVGFGC